MNALLRTAAVAALFPLRYFAYVTEPRCGGAHTARNACAPGRTNVSQANRRTA